MVDGILGSEMYIGEVYDAGITGTGCRGPPYPLHGIPNQYQCQIPLLHLCSLSYDLSGPNTTTYQGRGGYPDPLCVGMIESLDVTI